ncbi:glycosyltransferase family 2 protein [Leptolyngbya sp. FACHB-261]|uniref:glycosyltransferase family 2 protein n=1 Tax=Leptolyngbya sp. FACHB-261 TaxID=2692806 RepID=UPI0016873903|nr:glycosyltransferase family A protein [Leptolyngbya sp. FACHB-261]MBD2099623.1 glycosyltransferase family 2 protein [Leptolyngbya sp. FACHB-261]
MAGLLFSVVIPTYQRNNLLTKCLDRLAPGIQTLPVAYYEVIVTDDGQAFTAEALIQERYPWAKWVTGPHKGPAANRNNGAKYAQGKWLVFTDDDCLPEPTWLEAFSKSLNGAALALEGAICPEGDPNQDLAECPVNLTGDYFWSANIAVQRVLFEAVGGFDPSYPLAAHEDQDLKLRLASITPITFVSTARVFHPVRLTSLRDAVTRIPKRCSAWAHHVSKHKTVLKPKGDFIFIVKSYKFHAFDLLRKLYYRRPKSALVSLADLLFGIPLTWLYLSRRQQSKLDKRAAP